MVTRAHFWQQPLCAAAHLLCEPATGVGSAGVAVFNDRSFRIMVEKMFAYRKWAALLVASLTLWLGQAHAEQRPAVAEQVKAYMGTEGVKVWTLRIGERAANEALVQVEGVDHDWNMRIQKMQVEKTAKDTRYWTTVGGNKFVVLIVQGAWTRVKCCNGSWMNSIPTATGLACVERWPVSAAGWHGARWSLASALGSGSGTTPGGPCARRITCTSA